MGFNDQLKSVIQWENPNSDILFFRYTASGDELKNSSKLVLSPGQGCLFLNEGRIEGIFEEEGTYSLDTDNVPFLTSLKQFFSLYKNSESAHKTGLWFYRKADNINVRWGTRSPIKYNDPVYVFPVALRAFGNYSFRISEAIPFFTNVVASADTYTIQEIQEVFVSRIVQPITDYLAKAKFSYAEIDSNVIEIAKHAKEASEGVFFDLGFSLLDFRIEGTSFDEDTQERIGRISDVNADVQAAKLAGLDYAQMEQLKAMRDAAKNEGTGGLNAGLATGIQMGQMMNQAPTAQQPTETSKSEDPVQKLKKLKELFEMELITEAEFTERKKVILDSM